MSPARRRRPRWARLSDQELLDWPLCELDLSIEGTALEGRIARLYAELDSTDLRFRPRVWLSTDWFTPEGVGGFAVPFYLAHPRLARLERRQMFEVEGVGYEECMKLLRHETGHALDNAYRLHWRKTWREHFGAASEPYRATYFANPASRRHVIHLDNWYSQSHPIEDFAETFAVWLKPRSGWRRHYAEWPAMRKLEYVDELMEEISHEKIRVRSRRKVDAIEQTRFTLREYFRRKRIRYGPDDRSIWDRDLQRLFTDDPERGGDRRAGTFLRTRRRELRRLVARWTGQYQWVVDQALNDMIIRASQLGLRLAYSERETSEGVALVLASHTTLRLRRRHVEYYR